MHLVRDSNTENHKSCSVQTKNRHQDKNLVKMKNDKLLICRKIATQKSEDYNVFTFQLQDNLLSSTQI